MDRDEPNFVFKGINAFKDMGCIIENEILEVSPSQRYESIIVTGRHGELHETFGDYDAYDLKISNVTIPYDRLKEVKGWLRGHGQLITHNDLDKYRDCVCNMGKENEFENEIGHFYKFDVSFRCQPFKKKVREIPIEFKAGSTEFFDPGQENCAPFFELVSSSGDITIQIGDKKLTLKNTIRGNITVDAEHGKAIQEGLPLFTKGQWPRIVPGTNIVKVSGSIVSGKMWNRSVWL